MANYTKEHELKSEHLEQNGNLKTICLSVTSSQQFFGEKPEIK